jgi:CIC family chloride channel protein
MEHESLARSNTGGLAVAPSLAPTLDAARVPRVPSLVDGRVVQISAWASVLGIGTGLVAQVLVRLINVVTNLAFYGRLSARFASPAGHHLGVFVVLVPVVGGLVVGAMARYGSKAIRGHGIPEAMEQVLLNQSRIPPRITLLKPLSAAVSIGTGGPFGAEGPIIATGGALGSLLGQLLETTAAERKTLLAAGAAAGMAATFGSPVSAVLLAVELLLFELRPRSIVPVALASAVATGVRMTLVGSQPVFAMPSLAQPSGTALAVYIALGAVVGVLAVLVTRAVYAIEDGFEKLPLHWMWWPALGAVVVGLAGLAAPRTLGVGYDNIEQMVDGRLMGTALLSLCVWKLVSWSLSLGSGTSGGTLAPLFTIGGAFGGLVGGGLSSVVPSLGVDPRIAALVGMAAIFAGASRALLASVVFAFETTLQPLGLLPLLGGCTASYLVSCLLMRHSIMTEKIARRGVRVPAEYHADYLDQVTVREGCNRHVVAVAADDTVEEIRQWINAGTPDSQHQGFPVVNADDELVGLVSRRHLFDPSHPPQRTVREVMRADPPVIFEDFSLREAADHMVREGVGRLPVVSPEAPRRLVGILTHSDLLAAHGQRLDDMHKAERSLEIIRFPRRATARRRRSRAQPDAGARR